MLYLLISLFFSSYCFFTLHTCSTLYSVLLNWVFCCYVNIISIVSDPSPELWPWPGWDWQAKVMSFFNWGLLHLIFDRLPVIISRQQMFSNPRFPYLCHEPPVVILVFLLLWDYWWAWSPVFLSTHLKLITSIKHTCSTSCNQLTYNSQFYFPVSAGSCTTQYEYMPANLCPEVSVFCQFLRNWELTRFTCLDCRIPAWTSDSDLSPEPWNTECWNPDHKPSILPEHSPLSSHLCLYWL